MKDDFFDSLSSNAFDRSGQIERPRYSEQRKLDTEVSVDSLSIYNESDRFCYSYNLLRALAICVFYKSY